jgi:hypothetical protein
MSAEQRDDGLWKDGLWKSVAALPAVTVDDARAERVRARCHRALEDRRQLADTRSAFAAAAITRAMRAWHMLRRLVSRVSQPGRPGLRVSGSARS